MQIKKVEKLTPLFFKYHKITPCNIEIKIDVDMLLLFLYHFHKRRK